MRLSPGEHHVRGRSTCAAVAVSVSLAAAGAAAQTAPASGRATEATRITVRAARVATPPVVDGHLSDQGWTAAEPVTALRQRDPDEGQPASEGTDVRVLIDDVALYVGARLFDRHPDAISRRPSPRDEEADADQFGIFLDPRHDHRTGVAFIVSAAGVQRDLVISNDTREDTSWDAVWTSAVSIDAGGWTAELRIPLSQLRFNRGDPQVWGINLVRFLRRRNETVWAELVPKNDNGLASRMGHLVGLDGIRPVRHVEFVPYLATRSEFVAPDRADNPFNDGSQLFGSMGLDVKAGLGGSFTVDATINPDFGQAEVDPAVVNLTAFETFFSEKRRFFIEGSEIFNTFGTGGANNFFGFNTADPDIFYSRRIGRGPTGEAQGDFIEAPRATTILGAVKLTGKTADGWSVGLIEAVTSRERARAITDGVNSLTDIEPLSNYAAARVLREFDRGGLGFLATSVRRRVDTPALAAGNVRRAEVIGGDGYYFLDGDKDWVVTGKLSTSRVAGSPRAILDLQRAPQRYYQRPDAGHVSVDSARTSLTGYAGRLNLNRNSGMWRANASIWGVSPAFESNDLGFHGTGDRAGGHGVLLWVNPNPNRVTREHVAWIARAFGWNFDRERTTDMWYGCSDATFLNYWSINGCIGHFGRGLDDRLTRGGPAVTSPAGRSLSIGGGSDRRKGISFSLNVGRDSNEAGGESESAELTLNFKPFSSLTVSTGPGVHRSTDVAQYVRTEASAAAVDTFGERYVFATIEQTQVGLTTRVSYAISPRASLQVFMQPLLATGDYGRFKELARPRTFDFREFGDPGSALIYDADARRYTVTPDFSVPNAAFSFDDPNFNFKSLRMNAVFRWEFRPGSTLYAVWIEQREDFAHPGDFRFGRDAAALFTAPADDILLIKMAYWLGR